MGKRRVKNKHIPISLELEDIHFDENNQSDPQAAIHYET